MRVFFALVLIVVCCVFGYSKYKPEEFGEICAVAYERLEEIRFKKEIRVEGNLLVEKKDILSLLPFEKSNWWWHINSAVAVSGLLSNPLIRKADVESCTRSSWSCFVVSVEEREPAFFALVGQRAWIVGADGGVIKPVPTKSLDMYLSGRTSPGLTSDEDTLRLAEVAEQLKIPVISGLSVRELSSDIVKARFAYLHRILELIEEGAGLKVSFMQLAEGEDVKVRFFGYGFVVVFPAAWREVLGDESGSEQASAVKEKASRLKVLLEQIKGREDQVSSIDLGFDRVAVISPKEAPADVVKKGTRVVPRK